jgi:uncharacterized protein (TIGR00297 family)
MICCGIREIRRVRFLVKVLRGPTGDNSISPERACQYKPGRLAHLIRGKTRLPAKTRGVEWGLRLGLGGAICGAVAFLALRLGALAPSGAGAATALGVVLVVGGGWSWLALVGVFFATASIMTRWAPGGKANSHRSLDVAGRRWDQVVANGGIAGVAAAVYGLSGSPLLFEAAAGAIAAATADTWATEVGRWSPTPPRLITTGLPVLHGRSGGVTPLGTAASVGGALLIAVAATALAGRPPLSPMPIAILAGGFSGSLLDSMLGATIEGRFTWIDNSLINLLATTWGAGVALAGALWWG